MAWVLSLWQLIKIINNHKQAFLSGDLGEWPIFIPVMQKQILKILSPLYEQYPNILLLNLADVFNI